MADGINVAQPANAGAADPVGDPAAEPAIPFSAATNSTWEAQVIEKIRELSDQRAYKMMNGRRVTVWRICVEKRRREQAALYGVSPGALTELPPDCRGKILEFLPAVPSSGMLSGAEMSRISAKRAAEVGDKFAEILLAQYKDFAEKHGVSWGWGLNLRKSAITEQAVGHLCWGALIAGKWWESVEMKTKIEALGYTLRVYTEEEIGKDATSQNPNVVTITPRTAG